MQEKNNQESILITAGMHRSGTSLTAALIQSAGVDIGKELMEGDHVNIKGHFENIDFVNLHKRILDSQQMHPDGWSLQDKIEVEEQYIDLAKEFVARNSGSSIWGWKDPRTTLFLDFWAELLPQSNFIFIHRLPWEVADSLYRRGDIIFLNYPDLAVKAWIHYNKKVLEFAEKFPSRCCLFSIYSVARNTQAFINAINEKFSTNLGSCATDIYDASMLKVEVPIAHRPTLVNHYFPQAIDIYQELSKRAVQLDDVTDSSWLEQIKSSPYKVWAFKDWVEIRSQERHKLRLQAELEGSQAQLQQTQAEVAQYQTQLQQTKAELEQYQTQLEQTKAELERSQSQQQHTQAELERSQSQQQHTQAELERSQSQQQHTQTELEHSLQQATLLLSELQQTQAEREAAEMTITAMKTSKFWKLRGAWFNFKRGMGLNTDDE